MKKTVLWSAAIVVILGMAVGAFLWLRRPQVITLKDGTKLTLLGVDYGKRHKFPEVKVPGAHHTRGDASSFDTEKDTLVVWLLQEHKPDQWPNLQTLVYDTDKTGCAGNWAGNTRQLKAGVEIVAVQLNAFPRRDRKLYLRFMSWTSNGQNISKEQFVVSNPARKSYPKWTPSALPATQSDGDLDVTLTRLVHGVKGFNNANGLLKDAGSKAVLAAFQTTQNGTAATNWQVVHIITSDATGNEIPNHSWSTSRDNNGDATITYQWGLWPDEAAWKLRVEMSRTSGFANNEVWTINELPIKSGSQQDLWTFDRHKTDAPIAETDLNGVHLQIFPVIRFNDMNNGAAQKTGGFRVMASTDPTTNGFRLTALKVTDENGRSVQSWGGGSGDKNFTFQVPDLRNAKSLNITLALHQSRFVEFIAKPAKQ